jgi:hypothetical protein
MVAVRSERTNPLLHDTEFERPFSSSPRVLQPFLTRFVPE